MPFVLLECRCGVVDVVRLLFVVEEEVDGRVVRQAGHHRQVGRIGSEPGAAKQVIDKRIVRSHQLTPEVARILLRMGTGSVTL